MTNKNASSCGASPVSSDTRRGLTQGRRGGVRGEGATAGGRRHAGGKVTCGGDVTCGR